MRAFFLPLDGAPRFCLFHAPAGALRGAVLYVHPLAEEMNLARRMAALQSRAFADRGYAVLQMDLYGCGDSGGDFAAANWSRWRDDVVEADRWLQAETGVVPWLWGLRAGCLLAVEAALARRSATHFLFWQPVVSGEQHWRQWSRVQQGHELAGASADKAGSEADGNYAGYPFAADLVDGLSTARLALPAHTERVTCIEVTPTGQPSPAVQAWVAQCRAEGIRIDPAAVAGPGFWQSPEAPDVPALIEATLALFEL